MLIDLGRLLRMLELSTAPYLWAEMENLNEVEDEGPVAGRLLPRQPCSTIYPSPVASDRITEFSLSHMAANEPTLRILVH